MGILVTLGAVRLVASLVFEIILYTLCCFVCVDIGNVETHCGFMHLYGCSVLLFVA